MRTPLISIIIPVYNYAHTLAAALDSVLQQGLDDIEVLVCDDASPDHTADVVAGYRADPRVRYRRQPQNVGVVANVNCGLALARGQFVHMLSADDMLLPGYYEKVLAFHQAFPELDVVYTELCAMAADASAFEPRQGIVTSNYAIGRNEFAALLSYGCYIFLGSVLARRRLYDEFGKLDDSVTAASDLELLVRWAANGAKFGFLAEALVAFRVHPTQLSGRTYIQSGDYAHEFLRILDLHVTPERAPLLRHHEAAIARHVQNKTTLVSKAGYVDDGELPQRTAAWLARLGEIRSQNAAPSGAARLGIVLVDTGTTADLEESLQHLLLSAPPGSQILLLTERPFEQQYLYTEAVRERYLRVVPSPAAHHLGRRLNNAIRISDADALMFLHAGTLVDANHLRLIQAHFSTSDQAILLHQVAVRLIADETSCRADLFCNAADVNQALLVPHLPLEGLTIGRRIFDRFHLFSDELGAFPEWEYFLKIRPHEKIALAPGIGIEIRERPATIGRRLHAAHAPALINQLHAEYGLRDDERLARRALYLADIERVIRNWDSLRTTTVGLAEILQAVHGRRALTAQPAIPSMAG